MFAAGVAGSTSTKLKFRLVGGGQPLLLLPVRVNGRGPFEFILDTGAGITLVTPELAAKVGIGATGAREGHSAGGKVSVSLAELESIEVGSVRREQLQVGILDLGQIARTIGSNVDGDLGYNFLQHFRLRLDYRRNELRLDDPKKFEFIEASPLTELPIRLAAPAKPIIVVETFINGSGPFNFAIDTGTSTSAISAELSEHLGLQTTPIGPVTTGGAPLNLAAGRVGSMQIGGARLADVAVVIGPFLALLSQAAETKLDGIVGHNFLKNFQVMIDYPNLKLSLFAA